MHFLIRLNDRYESIRGQILLMDPLSNVSKAYCMIARVETQRYVTGSYSSGPKEIAAVASRTTCTFFGNEEPNSSALVAKSGYGLNQKNKKDNRRPKGNRFCDHCQRSGHTQD